MEMENQNWPPSERKNIDLSGALDDVIEQRRAGVYQKIEEVKKIPVKKKKIYILIIIFSWVIIAIIVIFLLGGKGSKIKDEKISPDELLKKYLQENGQ